MTIPHTVPEFPLLQSFKVDLIKYDAELQKPHKPTNQVWRKVLAKNEQGFVDSALIPFNWESRNQFMNRFLKTEACLKFC